MIKILIVSLLFSHLQASNTAPAPPLLIKQFMQDIVDHKLDEPALTEKYMCPSLMKRTDKSGEKARMLFQMTVTSYREKLHKQRIDPKDLVIVSFDEMANNSVEIIGDTKDIYVARYKGKIFGRFLMQDGRIAGLNLLHKGAQGPAYFISYCE